MLILEMDYCDPASYVDAQVLNINALRDVKDLLCAPLAGTIPLLEVKVTTMPKAGLPDYFEIGPLPIVSSRLRDKLLTFDVKAEFFPVAIKQPRRKTAHPPQGYYFMHPLEEVDCVDKRLSEYTEDDGYYDRFTKLVLSPEKAFGKQLFRLAMSYDPLLCVGARLADALKGWAGVHLITPQERVQKLRH